LADPLPLGRSPLIRTGNPAIDVADLESRVRWATKQVEDFAAMTPSSIDEAAFSRRMRYVRELLADTETCLVAAAERSAPRTSPPPRLIRLGPLGIALIRALNYAFKSQRESDAQMRSAVRGATAALSALADLIESSR
jgi:hypothetical protein